MPINSQRIKSYLSGKALCLRDPLAEIFGVMGI